MKLKHKFPLALALLTSLVAASVGLICAAIWFDLAEQDRSQLVQILAGQEILLVFLLLAVIFAAYVTLQIVFRNYLVPAVRIEDGARIIQTVNPAHRVPSVGGEEMRRLAGAVNKLAEAYAGLKLDVEARISEANARLEEEKNRLAALMSDLTQSVLVCNTEGRILLYNARAKQLLDRQSEEGLGIGGAYVGLGRSIFSIVDKNQIVHALDGVKQKLAQENASPVANFVMTKSGGQLVRACMAPVLGRDRVLGGFVLTLEDITRSVEVNSRRDTLLQSLTEGTRASLASIRAAIETMQAFPDMEPERRDRFAEVIKDEAEKLSARLSDLLSEHADTLKAQWPLDDMLGADLLSALKRRFASALGIAVEIDSGETPLWLRVDSYSIVQVLTQIMARVQGQTGVEKAAFSLRPVGRFARLEMSWQGTASVGTWLPEGDSEWLYAATEASGLGLREVLERHGGEAWCKTDDRSGLVHFCIQLPVTRPEGIAGTSVKMESRPEYYDFDLFSQPGQSPELDERPLTELAYTVFDTETTGLNPSEGDEIISIGAVRIVNGRLLRQEVFEQLVDPRRPISRDSTKIHGISSAMLAGQPTIQEVLPAFHRFAEDTVLVAHNAAFDMRFLQLKEGATGVKFVQPVLDTLLLSAVAHQDLDHTEHGLESLATRLGISVIGRHTALGDAMATGEVFLKLVPLLTQRGIITLKDAREASQKTLYAKLGY